MYKLFSGKQSQLSQFHKKIRLGFQLPVELNLLKPLYVHTDHLGTFDNYNSRLKLTFPSQSSALMKSPIRWGVFYFSGGNVYGGSLCFGYIFLLLYYLYPIK